MRRDVPGFPGYTVDDMGVVYGRNGEPRRPWVDEDGYQQLTLYRTESRHSGKRIAVHRAVALAFLGPAPNSFSVVRHLDGDPGNNTLVNIAWGTGSQNSQDRIRHGRTFVGARNPNAHLSDDDVRRIRALRESGWSQQRIAGELRCGQSQISRILRGEMRREVA